MRCFIVYFVLKDNFKTVFVTVENITLVTEEKLI